MRSRFLRVSDQIFCLVFRSSRAREARVLSRNGAKAIFFRMLLKRTRKWGTQPVRPIKNNIYFWEPCKKSTKFKTILGWKPFKFCIDMNFYFFAGICFSSTSGHILAENVVFSATSQRGVGGVGEGTQAGYRVEKSKQMSFFRVSQKQSRNDGKCVEKCPGARFESSFAPKRPFWVWFGRFGKDPWCGGWEY